MSWFLLFAVISAPSCLSVNAWLPASMSSESLVSMFWLVPEYLALLLLAPLELFGLFSLVSHSCINHLYPCKWYNHLSLHHWPHDQSPQGIYLCCQTPVWLGTLHRSHLSYPILNPWDLPAWDLCFLCSHARTQFPDIINFLLFFFLFPPKLNPASACFVS